MRNMIMSTTVIMTVAVGSWRWASATSESSVLERTWDVGGIITLFLMPAKARPLLKR